MIRSTITVQNEFPLYKCLFYYVMFIHFAFVRAVFQYSSSVVAWFYYIIHHDNIITL